MKNLTIGQKISGGFAILILLACALGGVALFTMQTVQSGAQEMSTEFVPEASLAANLNEAVASTQLAARSYGFTAEDKYLQEVRSGLDKIDSEFASVRQLSDTHPQLVKLRAHLGDIESSLKDYRTAVNETEAKNKVINQGRTQLNTAATGFIANIDKIIAGQNEKLNREVLDFATTEKLGERHRKLTLSYEIRGEGNAARIAVFKAQAMRDPAIIAEAFGNFEAMDKRFTELKSLLKAPADLEELAQVKATADHYLDEMKQIMASLQALETIGQKRAAAGNRLAEVTMETAATGMRRTVTAAEDSSTRLGRASWTVRAMLGLAITLGIIVALVIIRGINRALRSATDSLSVGTEQIVAAAGQVASSSQSLAEGASEQAASLEETSSSIEEMSGMTRRNAESAQQARAITQAARASADQSAAAVTKLNTAMDELKASSAAVAKIVKSIDEIAFQTNILALNAAVEAARAGEAGAGFAVVAEEVRSLAQRSAQSAKETAEKIEAALTKSDEGARISQEVSASLGGIIDQVRKLDGLVAEIAQASGEQSQGIEQVNTAVTQIDKITQSNAAAAEESASASEELNAQAADLNILVGDLLSLVGGRRTNDPIGKPGAPKSGGVRRIDHIAAKKASSSPAPLPHEVPVRKLARTAAAGPTDHDTFFR
jgi:CHASE3 domain sensor protein